MNADPKAIVEPGYDAIADRYAEWAASFETPAMCWVDGLLELLPDGSRVLDLGCGSGGSATRALAARHAVTGVDISKEQIARARRNVAGAMFLHGDAAAVDFAPASFDAVVSLFMFGHVPRAEQGPLLARIEGWLRPGGLLLATMGVGGSEDVVERDWLGAPMFFASFDADTNRVLLERAGFELLRDRVVPHEEPGHGRVSFMWVLARKPE